MRLAIDSVTDACSAALFDDDGALIDERHETIGRGHAERLVPMIGELLQGRRPSAILVDCGPGSFTGLRVGLAAAHGLALTWKVPLSGFSSLALLAAGRDERELAAAMIGGHGELFVQSFAHGPLRSTSPLRSLRPEDAARETAAPVVVGSGAEALVKARGSGKVIAALPRAADAMRLPEQLRSLPPRPIYGRPPDAKPASSDMSGAGGLMG